MTKSLHLKEKLSRLFIFSGMYLRSESETVKIVLRNVFKVTTLNSFVDLFVFVLGVISSNLFLQSEYFQVSV